MRGALLLAISLAAACSDPPVEDLGCATEAPSRLGRSCSGDGECGNWLVCDDATCSLPPAVSGEGGTTARLVGGAEPIELQVEIARGDLARARGLGHRPCIVDGWGMILEFPTPGPHSVTTQTMNFPLDIALVDAERVVRGVFADAPPGGEALYAIEEPTRSVLEVPAGVYPIELGTRLEY